MKRIHLFLVGILFLLCLVPLSQACSDDSPEIPVPPTPENPDPPTATWKNITAAPDNWDGTKRADISYQLLVYSFADKDGDKYGDLNGLIDKLDYINSLGVTALWLSPIHPAMSYHGYDVTDHTKVNPKLGTEADFDRLITEAHKRNIKIYLDYVMNHTGKAHPWFKEATSSTDNLYRSYYLFSQSPQTEIAEGKIAMIPKEEYAANEWFATSSEDTEVKGIYTFSLDWSKASQPTVTVTRAEKADADNPDPGTNGAKYLYFGEGICKKFYDKGNNHYELTTDFVSSWGFLIRTSNDPSWPAGTKYGATSASHKVTLGTAFTLENSGRYSVRFHELMVLSFPVCHRLLCRPQLWCGGTSHFFPCVHSHGKQCQRMDRPRCGRTAAGCCQAHLPQCYQQRKSPFPEYVLRRHEHLLQAKRTHRQFLHGG